MMANALRSAGNQEMGGEMTPEIGQEPTGSTLTLSQDMLPEIAQWQPGQTYSVTLTVKQMTPSANGSAEFEIVSAQSGESGM